MSAEVRSFLQQGGRAGFVEYEIEGTAEEVSTAIRQEFTTWPALGYGTNFEWPPENARSGSTHAPTDLGGGRWIARGWRSNSCD